MLQRWLNLGRLIPLITIIGAGVAIVISLLGLIEVSIAESILIALLALIAADALSERIGVLYRLEKKLSKIPIDGPYKILKSRGQIPEVEEFTSKASEIYILGISAHSVIHKYLGLFRDKVKNGCKIRIILLNPSSDSIEIHKSQYGFSTALKDINATLEVLPNLLEIPNAKGSCEVRFSGVLIPFSMFGVATVNKNGSLIVEYHSYKRTFGEYPHVLLTSKDSSDWFRFYQDQFESVWIDSLPVQLDDIKNINSPTSTTVK